MSTYEVKLANETKSVTLVADEFVITPSGRLELFRRTGTKADLVAVFAPDQWQYLEVQ